MLLLNNEQVLTPEESWAVLDLYHLRERTKAEDGGYVEFEELRQILGVTPEELIALVVQVRSILPARLAVSQNRLSVTEAELIVAIQTREPRDEKPPILDFDTKPFVEVARSRKRELIELERASHKPGHAEDFEIKVGENPHSWAIVWFLLGSFSLILIILLVFFRSR